MLYVHPSIGAISGKRELDLSSLDNNEIIDIIDKNSTFYQFIYMEKGNNFLLTYPYGKISFVFTKGCETDLKKIFDTCKNEHVAHMIADIACKISGINKSFFDWENNVIIPSYYINGNSYTYNLNEYGINCKEVDKDLYSVTVTMSVEATNEQLLKKQILNLIKKMENDE